jgi:hypothetical protein
VLDVLSHDATTVAYLSASIAALTINRFSSARRRRGPGSDSS